jgi:LPXTG-motif cell wall-anchored protein
MTVSDFLELGVLVRNLDDPTLTKYCPIYNQSYDSINHSSQAGYGSFNSGNLAAPAGWTLGRVRQSGGNMLSNSFGTGQMQWIIPSTGIGPTNTSTTQSNIYESVALSLGAQYMTPVHAVPILDKSRGCFAQDFSDINTQQYNSAEEIFGLTSNIQVEVLASYRAQVNGSAFKAGNTDLVNFKPFLYGATNGYDTSATVDEVNDIFSFEPTVNPPTTGNGTSPTYDYRNKHFNKRVETNAFVYTGAVNAIKVDQDGKPVPDAKFALIQRAEYNPGVETNQYANKVGITGGTSDPEAVGPNFNIASPTASTFANVWVQTTDATGKVSFDGVNPDTNSLSGGKYWIVELASPRGYKDLAHDTVPDLTDYGGTLVKAISLNWADHKVANDKPPADPDYKAMTKVINVPTLSLPNTGGNGLAWLIALGLGLLAGSLLIRRQTMMSRT